MDWLWTGLGPEEARKRSVGGAVRSGTSKKEEIVGYGHKLVMVSVTGTGLSLPLDIEPYGPGDSEYSAGQRLVQRAVKGVGSRFADYVVVDGEFATAPFLHAAGDLGLKVVARLKGNLPELYKAAQRRLANRTPDQTFRHGSDWVEIWDAGDFDPWESLRWETVRVVYYRQHKPDGAILQAYWLTDFSKKQAGSQAIFRMAKSRWQIENQGFNDAKNRYGFETYLPPSPQQPVDQLVDHGANVDSRALVPTPALTSRQASSIRAHSPAPLALAEPERIRG